MKLNPKGSPASRLWVIAEEPLPKDKDKGYLFSSNMGWSYDKLMGEAGIKDYYCTYFELGEKKLYDDINHYKPPFLVCLDTSGGFLLPQIKTLESTNLWAGSLLVSDRINYGHYIMPTFGPMTCIRDWTERTIVKYIDYGKLRDEIEYYNRTGMHQALPGRKLEIDLSYDALLWKLGQWLGDSTIEYISVDIETVYPKEKSDYFGHPGYPVTVGIAISPSYGISFSLFHDSTQESGKVWRALARLMAAKKIIGQNFHSFDAWFFDMLGMPCRRDMINDTMHRHAVLWPELPHKLQFLTRQYTRQPYYKSEGHGWSLKDLTKLKRYNALDVTVTYEIFLKQEEEFDERPYLR